MPSDSQPLVKKNLAKNSTSVTVLTSSTVVLTENLSRSEVAITNDDTNIVYLQLATVRAADGTGTPPTALAQKGIRLNASGGTWVSNSFTGHIAGISLVASCNVTVVEI